MNILIFTEAGRFGLGHCKRQIVLAQELERRGMEVNFISPFRELVGVACLQLAGYRVSDSDAPIWPAADVLIVDVEEYPGETALVLWKAWNYKRVILFGGAAYPRFDGESLVDLTIYQGELFDHPATDTVLNGAEYIIVDPAFAACRPDPGGHIVISMGGRDPFNFTPIALAALKGTDRKVQCIIGPQSDGLKINLDPRYGRRGEIYRQWPGWLGLTMVTSPQSLASYLDGAALCICATGMTAYESLCAGVPCVLGNISADHERTARELYKLGVAVNLGQTHEFTVERCAAAARSFLPHDDYAGIERHAHWKRMSQCARAFVDGRGVERVATKIQELIR